MVFAQWITHQSRLFTPLVGDSVAQARTLNNAADIDVFRIVTTSAPAFTYRGCSTTLGSLRVRLLRSDGSQLHESFNTSCSAPDSQVSVTSGVYFLEVTSPLGLTGPYQLRAGTPPDIDINSTAANAWTLSADPTLGRVIGSRFETTSDTTDWYALSSLSEGDWFLVETFGAGSNVNPVLELYTPSGTLYGRTGEIDSLPDTSNGNSLGHWMLTDNDGAFNALSARLAFQAPVTGTYYVRVRNIGTSAGRYYLAFEAVGTVAGTGWIPYP